MALLRFVCRDLLKVFDNETAFIDQVAAFIESRALKPKDAEKTIVSYYQTRAELELKLLRTLEGDF
jgi:IMP cyclohydrolase